MESTFGIWPQCLEIMPVYGDPVIIPVDEAACEARVRAAESLLETVNESVDQVRARECDFSSLAAPSFESCSSCSFRPHCRAYIRANPGLAEGWPLDLWATLTKVQRLGNGSLALLMRDSKGVSHSIKGLMPGDRHPALSMVQAETQIAVFNLYGLTPPKTCAKGRTRPSMRRALLKRRRDCRAAIASPSCLRLDHLNDDVASGVAGGRSNVQSAFGYQSYTRQS